MKNEEFEESEFKELAALRHMVLDTEEKFSIQSSLNLMGWNTQIKNKKIK